MISQSPHYVLIMRNDMVQFQWTIIKRLAGLREKGVNGPAIINSGTYLLCKKLFEKVEDARFSFEGTLFRNILEKQKFQSLKVIL